LKKGNLHLELGAQVTKILIKPGDNASSEPVAYGVQFYKNGKFKRVFVNKEIVVAASGIFTPKLLLLSGIGPAEDLEKLGIKVWVNSTYVGKNVQNNQISYGSNYWPNATYGSAFQVATAANEYAFNGTGVWANSGPFMWAYVCSQNVSNCTNPDTLLGIQTGPIVNGVPTVATQVENATPHLRGTVSLISSNPFDLANLTIPEVFQDPQDLTAHVYGWKLARRVFSTPPASNYIGAEITPGPEYATDEELTNWVLQNGRVSAHWVASCKMGNTNDPTRVTTPELKVVGIQNVRIGDVSIFPSVNSHAQSAAALAGLRVADFILNGH